MDSQIALNQILLNRIPLNPKKGTLNCPISTFCPADQTAHNQPAAGTSAGPLDKVYSRVLLCHLYHVASPPLRHVP